MRAIYNARERHFDISYLRDRLPDWDIALTVGAAEVAERLPGADALIVSNRVYTEDLTRVVNDRADRLRLIQFTTSGIDKALKSGGFPAGVTVANVAGLRAPNLADHSFALLLALTRRLTMTEAARRRREWIRDQITPQLAVLRGKTLCIVGMGATGQEMARRAVAFGMRVIGVSRAYPADDMVRAVYPRDRLKEALAEADAVLLSLPSAPDTRGLINADTLAAMKPGALLVNIARGDLVDEPALIDALKSGRIGGAGLDVTLVEPTPADSPLWDMDNVILTPHIAGGGTDRGDTTLFDMVIDNLQRLARGEAPVRTVDWQAMLP